jgi:urease subunit gamma/beta
VFEDGTRLAVISSPIAPGVEPGAGSGARTGFDAGPGAESSAQWVEGALQPARGTPGSILPRDESQHPVPPISDLIALDVVNTASVPISVTSHFHFFEANPRLRFDRAAAYGRHLAVPAGSSVRFDPGATVPVELVPIGGDRVAIGFAGLVDGPLDEPGAKERALAKAAACGYLSIETEA